MSNNKPTCNIIQKGHLNWSLFDHISKEVQSENIQRESFSTLWPDTKHYPVPQSNVAH